MQTITEVVEKLNTCKITKANLAPCKNNIQVNLNEVFWRRVCTVLRLRFICQSLRRRDKIYFVQFRFLIKKEKELEQRRKKWTSFQNV